MESIRYYLRILHHCDWTIYRAPVLRPEVPARVPVPFKWRRESGECHCRRTVSCLLGAPVKTIVSTQLTHGWPVQAGAGGRAERVAVATTIDEVPGCILGTSESTTTRRRAACAVNRTLTVRHRRHGRVRGFVAMPGIFTRSLWFSSGRNARIGFASRRFCPQRVPPSSFSLHSTPRRILVLPLCNWFSLAFEVAVAVSQHFCAVNLKMSKKIVGRRC